MAKDSFAYMNTWWFALLPQRLKEKVMARHYFRTAGSKTLPAESLERWRRYRKIWESEDGKARAYKYEDDDER